MKGLKMRLLGIFLAAAACPLTFLMSASKVLVIIGILCYVMAPILFIATKGEFQPGVRLMLWGVLLAIMSAPLLISYFIVGAVLALLSLSLFISGFLAKND